MQYLWLFRDGDDEPYAALELKDEMGNFREEWAGLDHSGKHVLLVGALSPNADLHSTLLVMNIETGHSSRKLAMRYWP